ncbi:MAG: amidohydrolase [Actinomycetota bacterium]
MTTTLFSNGTIRTNVSDGNLAGGNVREQSPNWVLVSDDEVRAVEPTDETPAAHAPHADRRVDLQGGCLIPAFCDAHVHLPATGLYAGGMDFRGVTSADEILRGFRRHAESGGAVMFGGNFEDPLDRPLTRHDLDRAVGERPAMLARADMHSCIVSSALARELEIFGLEGVDRNDGGEPTGYLREQAACGAWNWFETSLPRTEQIDAIRAAVRHAYGKGVATVHEMFVVEWRGWGSYDVFTEAIDSLALNVVTYLGTDEVDKVVSLGHRQIGGDYFLDGSFGSHTAWMREPFASPPPEGTPSTGIKYREDEELYAFFLAAHRAGLQVGVHAIGDAAIEQCIATWERVADEVGRESVMNRGHRIEHFECATDDLIERAARLALRASVQPAFDWYWGGEQGLYADRIGWGRASQMNRFKSMQDARTINLGAGSDSTVTPLDPFLQMRALRAHHVDEQRIDGSRALAMHTLGGHMMTPWETRRGQIQGGSIADLAWLSRDPVTCPPEELESIEVLGTWVAGARVWPDAAAETT